MDKIELRVGEIPKVYGGFKNMTLTRSIEAISSVFSFSFSDQWSAVDEPWPIKEQDPIEIRIGKTLMCKGYVDVLDAQLSTDTREYSIRGRDRTADLIDCSAPVQFGEMRNHTLLDICKKLSTGLGIPFSAGDGNWDQGPIALHKVSEGDTIFDSIQEAANKVGALLMPDGKGGVILTNAGTGKASTSIIEGENLLSLTFSRDASQRYSNYRVSGIGRVDAKGENWADGVGTDGDKPTLSLPRANVVDKGITRYRPLYLKQHGSTDQKLVQRLCEFEAKTREAKSLQVQCVVQGFCQANGKPWMINEEVQIVAPRLGLADLAGDVYVIAETSFELSESGQTTSLSLLPKNAFVTEVEIKRKKKDQLGMVWSREDAQRRLNAKSGDKK